MEPACAWEEAVCAGGESPGFAGEPAVKSVLLHSWEVWLWAKWFIQSDTSVFTFKMGLVIPSLFERSCIFSEMINVPPFLPQSLFHSECPGDVDSFFLLPPE